MCGGAGEWTWQSQRDLESWSNGCKRGCFEHLAFFLPPASLDPELAGLCQRDQGYKQSSFYPIWVGMRANTLSWRHIQVANSRRWQVVSRGSGLDKWGILGIDMQICRVPCVSVGGSIAYRFRAFPMGLSISLEGSGLLAWHSSEHL